MISVIIPIFNAENYIHRCIDSILAQSYADFELLLINDGSTDSSGSICNEYALSDNRVRVFHKENGGVSSARNMGLDNAKGEWIAFVDSDDYIIKLDSFFYNEDLIIFPYKLLSKDGSESLYKLDNLVFENKKEVKNIIKEKSTTSIFKTLWSKLYKRKLIGSLRFDESIRIGEDQLFLLEYLNSIKTCRFVNSYMYVYGEFQASKYQISIVEAIYTMKRLIVSCENLGVCDLKFRKDVLFTYKSFCQNDIDRNPEQWGNNHIVLEQWNIIKKESKLLYRLKNGFSLLKFLKILF